MAIYACLYFYHNAISGDEIIQRVNEWITMNVRNIFIKDIFRNIFIKIPTFILVVVVCVGMTSHAVRAMVTFSESETEKVDPQEEKKLYQRLNLSKLSRHTRIRNMIPFLNTGIEEFKSAESIVYQKPTIYERNHKIPILRAPPTTDIPV
jgi:hypothetical protein